MLLVQLERRIGTLTEMIADTQRFQFQIYAVLQKCMGQNSTHSSNDAVIFHCQSGMRTADNAGRLGACGIPEAYILQGGLSGWKAAGYPTRIDRSKPVSFSFDGKSLSGFAGDTVASAVMAAGQRVFGRSFKYHRPRGVIGLGSEEMNALVGVGVGYRF